MTVAQSGRSDVGTPGFGLPNDCSTPPKSQVLLTSLGDWLDRPLSGWSCTLGWCVATSIFVGIVVVLGGPALNDTFESVYSTWAISHGQLACAFPADFRDIPPVYPLLSGGLSALNHVGNNVPFPPRAALGPHCDRSFLVINTWSLRSGAIDSTIKIAYVGWLALLAGVVYFLRSVGRGRRGWEPATVVLIACIPPVWMCIAATFHPQDLIATGLALAALGSATQSLDCGRHSHNFGDPFSTIRHIGCCATLRSSTSQPEARLSCSSGRHRSGDGHPAPDRDLRKFRKGHSVWHWDHRRNRWNRSVGVAPPWRSLDCAFTAIANRTLDGDRVVDTATTRREGTSTTPHDRRNCPFVESPTRLRAATIRLLLHVTSCLPGPARCYWRPHTRRTRRLDSNGVNGVRRRIHLGGISSFERDDRCTRPDSASRHLPSGLGWRS